MNSKMHVTVSMSFIVTSLAASAGADFVTSRWTSGTSYELDMSHMTDFDQRRATLPGGGASHCVPTSVSNLFTYIAQHGYSYCAPGDHDWQSSANYSAASTFIEDLGDLMNTSSTLGTDYVFAYTVTRQLLISEVGTRFVVESESWSSSNVVSQKEMTKQSIDDDAIQTFCYGKYDIIGTNDCGESVLSRDGGHCMTFAGSFRSGSTRTITYNDPDGTSDSTSAQSTFTETTKDCQWVDDLVVYPSVWLSCTFGTNQSMSRIMRNTTSDSSLRLIDKRISIRPSSAYSWSSYTGFAAGGVAVQTQSLGWDADGGSIRNAQSAAINIIDPDKAALIVSPSGIPFFAVAGPEGGLYVEERGEQGAALIRIPLESLGIASVDDAVFAGDRTLVVRTGRLIRAIANLDAGLPGAEDNAPFIAWSAEAPFDVAKLVATRTAQGLGGGPHSVLAFSTDLRVAYEVCGDPDVNAQLRSIPAALPLNGQLLTKTTIVQDNLGTLWFAQEGSPMISALLMDGATLTKQLPIANLTGFALDDRDNLLIADGGIVRCFSHSPKGVFESGLGGSPFAGSQVGRDFTVSLSTSNYEARFNAGFGWRDVTDVEVVARPGDIDGDNVVGPQDLALALGAWGTSPQGGADLDGDGIVGPQDLAILLGNWGSGS